MDKIFGLQTETLLIWVASLTTLAFLYLAILAIRKQIILRISFRSIIRYPTQSALIMFGLMLSTAIIGASLGVGDTVTHSIRKAAIDGIALTDEVITPQGSRFFGENYLTSEQVNEILLLAQENDLVDGFTTAVESVFPTINEANSRSEARMNAYGIKNFIGSNITIATLADGTETQISDLQGNDALLNRKATETLNASTGTPLTLLTPTGQQIVIVKGIIEKSGLGIGDGSSSIFLSQDLMQTITNRNDAVDEILISNAGGVETGLEHSEEVTKYFRLALTNKDTAAQIYQLLATSDVIDLLNAKISDDQAIAMSDEMKDNLTTIVSALETGELNSAFTTLIADPEIFRAISSSIDSVNDGESQAQLGVLRRNLSSFNVNDIKNDLVRLAEGAGQGTTLFLTIFGSFSILVGLLLIFLVMVLLAAARSTEMGMVRAIGFRRSLLTEMFALEGWVYAAGASAIGTLVGFLISFVLVELLRRAINVDSFQIYTTFTPQSIVITFGVGFLLTLLTIVVSAARISRLNIVVAIRGLNEELARASKTDWSSEFRTLIGTLGGPITVIRSGLREKSSDTVGNQTRLPISVRTIIKAIAVTIPPIYVFRIIFRLIRILILSTKRYVVQGWPVAIAGVAFCQRGLQNDVGSTFSIGVMLSIIGLGLLIRKVLQRTKLQRTTQSRIAGSFEGGTLMVFWGMPFDTLEPLTGELSFGPEVFVLSGASMVGASVWLVMHNTQIILSVLNFTLGRITKLRAVFKVAIAYPFGARLRTGLTIAMFSMVIFTLMINMVLSNLDNVGRSDPDRITGGFDIVATTSEDLPINDFDQSVTASNILKQNDFIAVGRSTNFSVIARQDGAETRVFKRLTVKIADDAYFSTTTHEFSTFDKSYGTNEREIWDQLRNNPNLAVLSHAAISTGDPFSGPSSGFAVEGFDQSGGDLEWETISVELRPLRDSDQTTKRKVIGILDSVVDQSDWESPTYLVTKEDMLTELTGTPPIFDTYSIKLSDPSMTNEIIPLLETVFLENGLDAVSLSEQINESLESGEAFNKLFQGFTGLGLIVGIAAIGVLAIRAVVERRTSIATLRAIGYTPRMIQAQFLMEAVFITLMGVVIGMGLGTLTSWNIYTEISKEVQGLQFTVPWRNVLGLIILTSICSIVSAYIPARQASRIYPAEALRTE